MDASTILKVIRKLIGETEPYGDSLIDMERTKNLDKLIQVVEELILDLENVAVNKERHEGSMRMMGEKAHNTMEDLWSRINSYLDFMWKGNME